MCAERIQGLHHITLCTGTAQADVDFFVMVLGQRFVKRTLFHDGQKPIYHLYFADELGTPGTVYEACGRGQKFARRTPDRNVPAVSTADGWRAQPDRSNAALATRLGSRSAVE